MGNSYYLSDAPQVENHLVYTDDFHSGYSYMMDKINSGINITLLADNLRSEQVPAFNSMSDYFYDKGQWAAIMDNKQ